MFEADDNCQKSVVSVDI